MLEKHHGPFAGFDVRHMRAENLYALHLMLNHEKLRDMNFGREEPGNLNSCGRRDYEFNLSETKSRRRLASFCGSI